MRLTLLLIVFALSGLSARSQDVPRISFETADDEKAFVAVVTALDADRVPESWAVFELPECLRVRIAGFGRGLGTGWWQYDFLFTEHRVLFQFFDFSSEYTDLSHLCDTFAPLYASLSP